MTFRSRAAAGLVALLCLIGLAIAAGRGATAGFDAAVRASAHSLASPGLTDFMRLVTQLGSQEFVVTLSALLTAGLWMSGRAADALLGALTMLGAEFWMWTLKALVHRQRPEAFFDTPLPPSYSFPSGHALLSACLYGLIAELAAARLRGPARWVVRLAAAALILAVGFSRIYLGVHYPTDVMAGYITAGLWLSLSRELVNR